MCIRDRIKELVFIPNLIEIGLDYIIRPFYSYHISLRHYYSKDTSVIPPKRFEEMRNVVSKELNNSLEDENYIIHEIIRKSLLESTTKTIFEISINKFIIVEPKISLKDLYQWKKDKLL